MLVPRAPDVASSILSYPINQSWQLGTDKDQYHWQAEIWLNLAELIFFFFFKIRLIFGSSELKPNLIEPAENSRITEPNIRSKPIKSIPSSCQLLLFPPHVYCTQILFLYFSALLKIIILITLSFFFCWTFSSKNPTTPASFIIVQICTYNICVFYWNDCKLSVNLSEILFWNCTYCNDLNYPQRSGCDANTLYYVYNVWHLTQCKWQIK